MTREERLASLSAFLRDMRGKRTQKEVAEGAKIERSAYVNMENRKRGMGHDVAVRLARYYKKPMKDFVPYITDDAQRLRLIEGVGTSKGEPTLKALERRVLELENLVPTVEAIEAGQERMQETIDRLLREVARTQRTKPRRERG